MRDEHATIRSPAVFELIAPRSAAVPVKVDAHLQQPRTRTRCRRPSAPATAQPVDWVFARDLLPTG